jgi:2-amino-4-hydroxy-6-hydroxymethyldihydropteridine diphosphokinase
VQTAYIGIGSNLGDAYNNCLIAVEKIGRVSGCSLLGISPWYKTEPVGVKNQDWYVNGVVSISTNMAARNLIKILLAIEEDMGRIRKERWASRIIDLDILIFGPDIIREENLTIPHPFMHQRRFVMAPMVDLAPNLVHPVLGKTMLELLKTIKGDGQGIQCITG